MYFTFNFKGKILNEQNWDTWIGSIFTDHTVTKESLGLSPPLLRRRALRTLLKGRGCKSFELSKLYKAYTLAHGERNPSSKLFKNFKQILNLHKQLPNSLDILKYI